MVKDERFYAFIISYTSRSRSQIRRVCLHNVLNNEEKTQQSAGGPAIPLGAADLATLDNKMSHLEQDMRVYEAVLRERGFTPLIWPVSGKLDVILSAVAHPNFTRARTSRCPRVLQ